jgi:LacI family transcriptional regulator
MGGHVPDEDLARVAARIPLVAIGRTIHGLEHRCLRVENFDGGYRATRHLLDLGHARIAHITGLSWHVDAIDRRQGYAKALAEAGVPFDPPPQEGPESSPASRSPSSSSPPLVYSRFASNDQMAYGAALAFRSHGQRPRRVHRGLDDQPSAAYAARHHRAPAYGGDMAAAPWC